ncbi:hypothetical protein C1645_815785 [Glomus cerebriforme]|uniref:non-specific serine/threonine protein kinase n=1 Tax=Glomus cerebriforme TaxID=658196 RepID=A0A397TFH5_9GLOM|nr:hypothetical protein C1645_815785 [Glomus cerebriforme]
MNLFGTTTKKIKTYGKKSSERVVTINTWKDEVDEKLKKPVINSGSIPIKDTAKKNCLKKSTTSKFQTNKGVTSKNTKNEPVKQYVETKQRKTFTKGFTKSKHYLSPIQHSQKDTIETSHVHNLETVSLTSNCKSMAKENMPVASKSTRVSLTPKQFDTKYHSPIRVQLIDKNHSPSKDHNHCREPLDKVIITPLKEQNILSSSQSTLLNYEKENVNNSHNDIEIDSIRRISDVKHLEIDTSIKEHEHVTDELRELLNICDQKKLWTFEEFLGTDCLNNATKIGEASFSEVFTAYAPNFTSTRVKCVFKIIPFGRGKEVLVNGEEQCSVRDIAQEIKTTLELGGRTGLDPKLRVSFLKLYGVGICRGKYPKGLLKEWDRWDQEYQSESDRPDYFDDNQLYAVLIVEYGGLDLEHVKLKNWAQAWSVLTQVGWSIAQAEQHRDLHWGNITIKPTKMKSISYNLLLANINVEVETFGVRACIIDYTLSRMERGGEIIYVNILDEGYFTGKGDYQFDIYRMMREESKGDWKSFWPKNNVFWLHYVADKLLTAKRLNRPKKDSEQYGYYNAILEFKKRALVINGGYKSAMEAMKSHLYKV